MAEQSKKQTQKTVRKGTGKYATYRAREAAGTTVKCRRILRAINDGIDQPGWRIYPGTTRVVRVTR